MIIDVIDKTHECLLPLVGSLIYAGIFQNAGKNVANCIFNNVTNVIRVNLWMLLLELFSPRAMVVCHRVWLTQQELFHFP